MTGNWMIDGDNGDECQSPYHEGCEYCEPKDEEHERTDQDDPIDLDAPQKPQA